MQLGIVLHGHVSKSSAVSYIRVTDPERLFSMIGKVDTSQRSGLLPSIVRNILSVKIQALPSQKCNNTQLKFFRVTVHLNLNTACIVEFTMKLSQIITTIIILLLATTLNKIKQKCERSSYNYIKQIYYGGLVGLYYIPV